MSDFLDAVRLRLRSLRDQSAALEQLLTDGVQLDLSPLQEAKALVSADRILRRLETLADRLGGAVDPTTAAPGKPTFAYESADK